MDNLYVFIADDHPLYRDALTMLVRQLGKNIRTKSASCYDDLILQLQTGEKPGLILVDLNMPGIGAWEGLKTLRQICPETPLVVISSSESDQDCQMALNHGAIGFIPKSLDGKNMLNALKLILENKITVAPAFKSSTARDTQRDTLLTQRQKEVLQRLAMGEPNKVISRKLALSEGTVKLHIRAILNALQVSNRTQAVIEAEKLGLINKS